MHTVFMRILIATGLYTPDIGGPATYTKFLEEFLPVYGISLTVASFSAVRSYPKIIRHLVYLIHLFRKSKNVDIIYALDTVSVGVPALMVSYVLRKKLYLRVPGDYAWEQGQQRFGIREVLDEYLVNPKKPFPVRVLAWLQYRVARHALKVVVPSEYLKGVVTKWGISPSKIFRIYSALHPAEVIETKTELRARFGYEGFVVSTAGRLVPWKGIEALINAVGMLRAEGVAITLEIIGDGYLRTHLEHHAHSVGADTYVHFLGKLPTQELLERITASDVFVLNTSYEGMSHQLLEVIACGVPIVTTSVGGNVELITDGKEGLLVSYNNETEIVRALTRLRTDAMLRDCVVKNAREKVKLFREEVIIPEIVKLLYNTEAIKESPYESR